jgi:PhzF family phenazine biosynthesis protein
MTKKFNYIKLNAFTSKNSAGNPAACLYLQKNQKLSHEEMQKIAFEHKGFVSEVVFCRPVEEEAYELKYYSSECEVDFCGHGTIACMYYLLKNTQRLLNVPSINIITKKGILKVYNEILPLNAVFITAPEPRYIEVKVKEEQIADHLGILLDDISKKYPVSIIDAGLRTLIVPIKNLKATLYMMPDEQRLKEFCISNEMDIVLVFSTEVVEQKNIIRTRVFAPKFGYLEDDATGSGNSAVGYYMLKNNLWKGHAVSIEQNKQEKAFNIIQLKTSENKVLFGGQATTKIEGYYFSEI